MLQFLPVLVTRLLSVSLFSDLPHPDLAVHLLPDHRFLPGSLHSGDLLGLRLQRLLLPGPGSLLPGAPDLQLVAGLLRDGGAAGQPGRGPRPRPGGCNGRAIAATAAAAGGATGKALP